MSLSADQIIAALERRYDHQSARTMFQRVLQDAKLGQKGAYSKEDLERFVEVLRAVGDRLGSVPELLLEPAKLPAQSAPVAQAAPEVQAAPIAPEAFVAEAEEPAEAQEAPKADEKADGGKGGGKDRGHGKKRR